MCRAISQRVAAAHDSSINAVFVVVVVWTRRCVSVLWRKIDMRQVWKKNSFGSSDHVENSTVVEKVGGVRIENRILRQH